MASSSDSPESPAAGPTPGLTFSRTDLLRWLYLARLTLVTGILAGALRTWFSARPQDTLIATVMFLVALAVTATSFWYTHILGREPGENFLYAQVILDVALVTGIVHVTGGAGSSFAPLYILVISSGALLLPLPGGVLIGALASILYFADVVWAYDLTLRLDVALQLALFSVVALLTGFLGDRLRRAGIALGAVSSELQQLRLDTSDILANLATGVLTVDGEGRLAYVNPAAERFLHLPASRWMGLPVLEAVDERAPGMGAVLRRAIRERRPVDRFKTSVRGDDRELVLGISTAILDRAEDEPPSATAIFQDITDLERLEVLHRRADRLEAVAELSASLAHEIKNPLASIRSAVEQLGRGSLTPADRAVLEALVLSESDRLSRLLSEFLEFSGLRMGRREPVDLARLTQECVAVARHHPDAGHEVEITCRGLDDSAWVTGDSDLLHRAVFNLVLNAVQFAGPEGRVVVTLEKQHERPNPRGTRIRRPVRLAVRDSGPGVPVEQMARIFDPFYTTRRAGSGLGLAVVHRAVEAHEGAVFVERAPEGGAQFVLYLPGAVAEPEGVER